MTKKRSRILLDAVMTVMIVLAMLIQFTGTVLHEIIGFLLLLLLIVHLLLSRAWIKAVAKKMRSGSLSGQLRARAVVAILLSAVLLLLAVSSVAISTILAGAGLDWPFGSSGLWVPLHTIASYSLCILVVVHLAMHWSFIASAFGASIPYDPSRRQAIGITVKTVAAVGAIALGVAAVKEVVPQVATGRGGSTGSQQPSAGSWTGIDLQSIQDTTSTQDTWSTTEDGSSIGPGPGKRSGSSRTPSSISTNTTNITYSTTGDSPSGSLTTVSRCTLCHKNCSLSAPGCNRPYEEGLI